MKISAILYGEEQFFGKQNKMPLRLFRKRKGTASRAGEAMTNGWGEPAVCAGVLFQNGFSDIFRNKAPY